MKMPPVEEKAKKPPNHERWVISYADLLTLLLALFIVLFASSTRNKAKMSEEAESLIKAFHGTPAVTLAQVTAAEHAIMNHQPSAIPKPVEHPAPRVVPRNSSNLPQHLTAEMLALDVVKQILQSLLSPLISSNQVSLKSQPLTLTISLNDKVLFASGKAELIPKARTLLMKVSGALKKLPDPFTITVQGYTDDKPIKTAQFPSNWSLSTERAVSVVQLFADSGVDGDRLTAEGFGQYSPVGPNDNDADRAKNRRVVIVIHAPDPNGQ
jgi:chemotaxis protein MotB